MDSGGWSATKDIVMIKRTEKIGRSMIVYDASLVSHIGEDLFEFSSYPQAETVQGTGRGTTLFISHDDQAWALRHYY